MSLDRPNAAQSKVVVSSVNRFHSSVVDLRPIRAIHAIDHLSCKPLLASSTSSPSSPIDCNAVHFGFCSPVKQLYPSIVCDTDFQEARRSLDLLKSLSSKIVDLTSASQPSTPRNSLVLKSKDRSFNSLSSDLEDDSSQSSTPRNSVEFSKAPSRPLSSDSFSSSVQSNEIKLDTIDILAADVQTNLQALVSSFVARDKVNRRSTNVDPQTSRSANTSCFTPTSAASSIVFNEYIAPGIDFNKSRVKKAAAAFSKSSENDVPRNSPEPSLHSTSNGHGSSTGPIDDQPKCSPKPVDESRIIRRHKKKNIKGSIDTDQIIKKCEEIVSDIVPSSGSRGGENGATKDKKMSRVDYAKNRLQNIKVEEFRHQVRCDNGLNQPSGQKVSEARQRWEHTAIETSLQQQMFNALGINVLKSAKNPEIPHPKLTSTQRQHIRDRSLSPTALSDEYSGPSPVMPFLAKGSVAERVMLFERAPERMVLDRNLTNTNASTRIRPATWRTIGSVDYSVKFQSYKEKGKENREPQAHLFPARPSYQTVRRGIKSKSNIPQFYFPKGRPPSSNEVDLKLQKISSAFKAFPNGVTNDEFGEITKACGLSLYWKVPLFLAATGGKCDSISKETFLSYWKKVLASCNDPASKFVQVLSSEQNTYLLPDDFVPLIQDIVESHPGLTFLKEATEFHSRYIHTVIARIYYCVNRSWSGKITVPELRKSNFLQVLALLDDEIDINQITEYFSYEHFYVIYCKFWELDKDHDLMIDKNDLSRHNDHAISSRMIDRIFSGCVTRGASSQEGKMSYTEFVWFLISEEDKQHPTSIEYWFRCMDLDGDGVLSMYELEYFYEEQLQRMDALGIETLPFQDCLCQMLDIVSPKNKFQITLPDLKRCKMTPVFFDTFFNLEKYLDHEQRDPFASQRDHDCDGMDVSDWERYAAEEYELLVAEEGAGEQQDEMMFDDMDMDDMNELTPGMDGLNLESMSPGRKTFTRSHGLIEDDMDSDDYS